MSERIMRRARRIIEIASRHCSRCQEMQLYTGYAEPGYTDPPSGVIAVGNWNTITRWNSETSETEVIDTTPSRVANLLELMGVNLEWCDEWSSCNECGKLVRTQPDSHWWKPSYEIVDECEIFCKECLAAKRYSGLPEDEIAWAKLINADPRDVANIAIYADWLADRDDPREAGVREFLTLGKSLADGQCTPYWCVFNAKTDENTSQDDAGESITISSKWFSHLSSTLCMDVFGRVSRSTANWRDYRTPFELLNDLAQAYVSMTEG